MQPPRLLVGIAILVGCAVEVLGAVAGGSGIGIQLALNGGDEGSSVALAEPLRDEIKSNDVAIQDPCSNDDASLRCIMEAHEEPEPELYPRDNAITTTISTSLKPSATAVPLPSCTGNQSSSSSPPKFYLRILALGASITWGTDSTDGNGYREDLRQMIVDAGGLVNFVGSKRHGNMVDNQVEATPGYRLDQVQVRAKDSLKPYMPNLVIIHAGTNDCIQNFSTATAPSRLGNLIDEVLDNVPGTVVLVSTLIPNKVHYAEACIETFNAGVPAVVEARRSAGKLVYLVNMHNSSIFTTADLDDTTHPTDEGYKKMAKIWYSGLKQIFAECWLTPPVQNGVTDADSGAISLKVDGGAWRIMSESPLYTKEYP